MDYQDLDTFQATSAREKPAFVESFTVAAGPIRTQHFQAEPNNFNQRHVFTSLRVKTAEHGTWALYNLSPNSERHVSFGVGKIIKEKDFNLGPVDFTAAVSAGLVTGYQPYPIPMVGFHLRASFYEAQVGQGTLNVGAEVSATPYLGETPKGKFYPGIVGTTPYLSVNYRFGK